MLVYVPLSPAGKMLKYLRFTIWCDCGFIIKVWDRRREQENSGLYFSMNRPSTSKLLDSKSSAKLRAGRVIYGVTLTAI